MKRGADLTKYSLYGEKDRQIAPEFLHIELISSRARLHDWDISAHSHSTLHQIILLDRGSGILHVDGQDLNLFPQTLILLPSQCIHSLHFAPDAEGWVLSFAVELLHHPHLPGAASSPMFEKAQAGMARMDQEGRDVARLRWVMAQIAAEQELSGGGGLSNVLLAQLGLLLAAASALFERGGAGPGLTRHAALTQRFRALVDRNFAANWPISRYAGELGTTEPTLTRACRRAFGKAPGEMVQARLLLEAMRYLTYSNASISQIAGRLGFSDPAYFARFFKARSGVTASDFRRARAWVSADEREIVA
ncbi:helix-turn-helix domain-containing protein [Altererythrobacter sp. CC-YST694]|uniref:helix-turn-helix domain-containing protein n=1 Tax=Altererythrobacter sp. CC-YST694 TaxID=2755038 RepID=UPI001D00A42F|nr:helix-turn-helix domain-containing protein [Altererythrobacter sp. CC-YST694]MCB5426472.1 helix-turn-helix domain-containing protein [Altererythrobacter sp. CC-YST694]